MSLGKVTEAVQLFETPFTTAVLIHFPQIILTPRSSVSLQIYLVDSCLS